MTNNCVPCIQAFNVHKYENDVKHREMQAKAAVVYFDIL